MGHCLVAGTKSFRCRNFQLIVRLLSDKNVIVKSLEDLTAAKHKFNDVQETLATGVKKEMPEAPTTCCMSGCPNCVWLEYAEKLSEYFKDGGDKAMKELNEKISDENIKAFILHEWRMRQKK